MYESTGADNYVCGYNPEFAAKVYAKRRSDEKRKQKNERERRYYEANRQLPEPREFNAHVVVYLQRKLAQEIGVPVASAVMKRSVSNIIRDTAKKYDLRASDLKGDRRNQSIIAARHEAMVTAYLERPDLSLPQLGNQFNRDHTSVLHAVKKAGVWRNPAKAAT